MRRIRWAVAGVAVLACGGYLLLREDAAESGERNRLGGAAAAEGAGTSSGEVLAELEAAAGVRIEVEAALLEHWKLRGERITITAAKLTGRNLLDLLCLSKNVRYEAVDGKIIVKRH